MSDYTWAVASMFTGPVAAMYASGMTHADVTKQLTDAGFGPALGTAFVEQGEGKDKRWVLSALIPSKDAET